MTVSWSKTIRGVLACGPRVLFLPTKQSARPIYSHDNATWKSSIDLHLRRSTCTSEKIDLHDVRHIFRPKKNLFRGQTSRRALFGHTGC